MGEDDRCYPKRSYGYEPTYDILRLNHAPLEPLFSPQTVAVIGASGQINTVG